MAGFLRNCREIGDAGRVEEPIDLIQRTRNLLRPDVGCALVSGFLALFRRGPISRTESVYCVNGLQAWRAVSAVKRTSALCGPASIPCAVISLHKKTWAISRNSGPQLPPENACPRSQSWLFLSLKIHPIHWTAFIVIVRFSPAFPIISIPLSIRPRGIRSVDSRKSRQKMWGRLGLKLFRRTMLPRRGASGMALFQSGPAVWVPGIRHNHAIRIGGPAAQLLVVSMELHSFRCHPHGSGATKGGRFRIAVCRPHRTFRIDMPPAVGEVRESGVREACGRVAPA